MKLNAIEGNSLRLDGGAMFGNTPKELWEKWLKPDSKNRIELASRSLLVQTDHSKHVLFDVGVGAFFEPKLKERYAIEEEHRLLKNLAAQGLSEEDIDAVILTHLHFDHAGGLLSAYNGKPPRLLFPKATYYLGKEHWEYAQNPSKRERASFIPELHALLAKSGRLQLLDKPEALPCRIPGSLSFSSGHTIGLLLPRLSLEQGPLFLASDLIPGLPWLHLPVTMGYDRFPELLVEEKEKLLKELLAHEGRLFFTHDPLTPCALVHQDERGRPFAEPAPL